MQSTPWTSLLRILLPILAAALAGCGSAGLHAGGASGDSLPRLVPERRQVAFLAAGESHRYALVVPADSVVRLGTEPGWRPDITLGVTGPDGETVLAPSPLHDWPCFGRSFSAAAGGRYEIEVAAGHAEAAHPGRYALTVAEVRPRAATDADLLAAEAAFVEVMADDEMTPESFAVSEELFRRAGSRGGLGAVALERGYVLARNDRNDEALRELDAASGLFAAAGDAFWQGVTEAKAAVTLAGDAEAQRRRFARAAELLAGGDPVQLGGTHYNWARWLSGEDANEEARAQWLASLPLRRQAGDICGQAQVLVAIGSVERPLGLLDSAEARYDDAAELLRDTDCVDGELENVRLNRAVLARFQGKPQQALDSLRALESELEASRAASCPAGLEESSGCRSHTTLLVGTYNNLGLLLNELGQLEAALERHEKAVSLADRDWSRVAKAWTLHDLERFAEAETEFQAVLAAAPPGSSDHAFALHGLGRLARQQGRWEEARGLLERALALHRKHGRQNGVLSVLQELGKLELEARDLGAAGGWIEQALAASRDSQDPERHARSVVLQAERLHRLGDLPRARVAYAEALRLHEEQRTSVREREVQISFAEGWASVYEDYIELLMQLDARTPGEGFTARAFEISERTRARSLAELLREAEIDVLARVDQELAGRYRAAIARLSSVAVRLAYRRDSPEERAAAEADRAELRRRRDELRAVQTAIATAYPSYADLVAPVSPSLPELQAGLGPGDALLEYSLGDERSVLFVLTREAFAAVPLAVSAGEIGRLVAAALPGGEFDPGDAAAATELYRWLVAPAEPWLDGTRRLLVVPHRTLHLLPFELLRFPQGGSGAERYLLERWEVAYTPSATVLRSLGGSGGEAAPAGLDFVAFAPSFGPGRLAAAVRGASPEEAPAALPHARDEVETIARTVYAASNRLYVDREATESRVKNDPQVHRARRLHFATHGVAGPRAELLGLLLPEQAPGEDGRLGLDEIFELDLDADLVVLSACETARGEQNRVEGLVGFGRAFFAAGAPSVIASLWKVSDRSTAPLMEEFYRQLEAGAGKAGALREAKLRLIEGNWASPYFWAPFILVGQPD